ncbi:MAG TPA: hypothetical protein VFN92_10140 [Solirubrobacterales bacterium]|nr:hypothetical protein [Solirubrobacterales bacterium]
MKRLGPDLKMPKFKGGETKVPPFLSDLYYDVRDRRLLPVILLILVAIVAAPILLKDEPEEVPVVPAPTTANPGSEQAAARTLTVVKSAPGLRDYKQRLKREKPSNPFKQQHTEPVLAGSELNETTTTTTTESTDGGSSGGGGAPAAGGGGSTVKPGQLTFFTFAINVRITKATTKPDGTVEQSEPEDRKQVIAPAPLPGEKVPAVTYMGLGGKNHLPLFMVSEEVTAVFGEGNCVSGTGRCQLIELEPGQPETFEYGENHVRYKINVLKIVPVVSGKS